jgi:nitroimidazol reductase NimA-like FMN-containing flavoprotein (pyridoxamine 5'-phosphate oxidase superfamily)
MSTIAEVGELERAECLRLLVDQRMGRVVFTDGALPGARPVNYVLDGEEVVFRTSRDGRLAGATRDKVVAFEVDSVDGWTRTGWSVLGVGEAYEVVDPARLAELEQRWPEPWLPAQVGVTVSIPLQMLSGRRILGEYG